MYFCLTKYGVTQLQLILFYWNKTMAETVKSQCEQLLEGKAASSTEEQTERGPYMRKPKRVRTVVTRMQSMLYLLLFRKLMNSLIFMCCKTLCIKSELNIAMELKCNYWLVIFINAHCILSAYNLIVPNYHCHVKP